jgi:predicted nucleotidyltransferase
MNISVKNVDENSFRKMKAMAAELNKSIGESLTESINMWTNKNKEILDGLEEIIRVAKNDKEIVAVILFGSYARDESDFRDVDVALLFKNENIDYPKKAADYYSSNIFDISILNRLPLNVASRVLEDGRPIYVSDWSALKEFSIKVIRDWEEFKPLYNMLIRID